MIPSPEQVERARDLAHRIKKRLAQHVRVRIKELGQGDRAQQEHIAALVSDILEGIGSPCDHTPDALRLVAEICELNDMYTDNPGLLIEH